MRALGWHRQQDENPVQILLQAHPVAPCSTPIPFCDSLNYVHEFFDLLPFNWWRAPDLPSLDYRPDLMTPSNGQNTAEVTVTAETKSRDFHLGHSLSWTPCSGGSQLPCLEERSMWHGTKTSCPQLCEFSHLRSESSNRSQALILLQPCQPPDSHLWAKLLTIKLLSNSWPRETQTIHICCFKFCGSLFHSER